MAQQRHLNNAPITEALIDIRTKLPDSFQTKEFIPLKEKLSNNYPIVEEQSLLRGHHEIKNGKPIDLQIENLGIQGFLLKTNDKKQVVQFRIDGFTFNRLRPYSDWVDIRKEAQELWPLYMKFAKPEAVTRLAVRYINQLNIPLPIHDFSEYLISAPNIPEELPQAVMSFLNRVTIYDSTQEITANITHSFESVPQPNSVTIILDIDVFKQGDFPIDNKEIWYIFEKLRDMKNRIFFSSITEKAARLFE